MYDKEKDFMINLVTKIIRKDYLITYKGTDYEYIVEVNDYDTEEWLKRSDGQELTDQEYDEIMDLIYDINDWDAVE